MSTLDEFIEALNRHGSRCVGKSLESIDKVSESINKVPTSLIVKQLEEAKNEIRSRIWAFKEDIIKEYTKGRQ